MKALSDQLELEKIRGYSKNHYINYRHVNDSLVSEKDSVHRLWANTLYPSIVFSQPNSDMNQKNGKC